MTAKIATKHRLLPMCLAAALLAGCSGWDAPLAVEPITEIPRTPRPSLTSYTSPNGSQVTLVDADDGTSFTLDILQREIRVSDGRVVELDDSLTAVAATGFFSVLQADQIVNQFMGFTCGDLGGCVEPMTVTDDESRPFTIELIGFDTSARRRNPVGAPIIPPRHPRRGGLDGNGVSSFDHDPYHNICTTFFSQMVPPFSAAHRSGRVSGVRALVDAAVGAAGGQVVRGKVGAATGAIATPFSDWSVDRVFAVVSLGVVALHWNTYDCANRPVRWDIFGAPPESSDFYRDCKLGLVQLNWPDGRTTEHVIMVCVINKK